MNTIDQFWANFFGLEPEVFQSSELFVVPHKELFGYRGAWIFRHAAVDIISVPSEILQILLQKKTEINRSNLFQESYLETFFDGFVEKFIGPAYQGYLSISHFKYLKNVNVRKVVDADRGKISVLKQSCSELEWQHSSIESDDEHVFIYLQGDDALAAANLTTDGEAFKLGVITHPKFRGKGAGAAVVQEATKFSCDQNRLPLYQTLLSNSASVKLAENVGFKPFAQTMAVRLSAEIFAGNK